jgi:hypothetical protein
MIDILAFNERLEIALQQKSNPSYRAKIAEELSKPEWQQRLFEIERTFSDLKNDQEFLKYQKSLVKLFEDLYEVITAPGVDEFIGWINEITTDKNNTNAKKLRDFLVERYSESYISESIDIINTNKRILEVENSIFASLLSEISKELKKETINILNDPKQFENKIADYFDVIESTLLGLSEIKELYYTKSNELFTKEQIDNNIDFYLDIVNLIIEKNQSLKPINEADNNIGLIDKFTKRISAINKCIVLLDESNIANSQDSTFRNLYLKFTEDMIKYEGGIDNNLEEFIDKIWNELESKYNVISEFFKNNIILSYDSRWDAYPNKDDLQSIILQYNSLIKENNLETILKKSTIGIKQSLTGKENSINDFKSYSTTVRNNILLVFKNTYNEYDSKNLALLESLAISKPSIMSICTEIKAFLDGLKNGINSIEKSTDLILYLSEDFLIDLNSNNDITDLFKKALNESGMRPNLEWLEGKLNGSNIGEISLTDLQDPILISELLEKGLIKINIEKQF